LWIRFIANEKKLIGTYNKNEKSNVQKSEEINAMEKNQLTNNDIYNEILHYIFLID